MANDVKIPTVSNLKAILKGVAYKVKMSVSYTDADKKAGKTFEQSVEFDFTGCTLEQVLQWAAAERRIALQRGLRSIETEEQFVAFITAGEKITISAKDAGKKPQQPKTQEQIAADAQAAMAQLSPEMRAELLKELAELK